MDSPTQSTSSSSSVIVPTSHLPTNSPAIALSALYPGRLPAHDIRLLTILPSNNVEDPIECELRQYALDEAPPYEALSYVWGDQTDLVAVKCNGVAVQITRNLRDALRRTRHCTRAKSRITKKLRNVLRMIRHSRHKKTIWADALCVNQRDDQEKNIHVPLMGRVFSQATNTVIYLGEVSDKEANTTRAALQTVATTFDNFTTYTKVLGIGHDLIERIPLEPPLDVSWDLIGKLFDVAWFERVWCVQEIELACNSGNDSYAMYGHVQIPYPHIVKTIWYLSASIVCNPEFCHGLDPEANIGVNLFLASIEPEENYLLEALDALRDHNASDPRDKVYGLLGILHEKFGFDTSAIAVQYSKSVSEVYTDAAKEILRQNSDLELLDHVVHPGNNETDPDYPSWVPRWDLPLNSGRTFPDMKEFRNRMLTTSPGVTRMADIYSILDDKLLVSGLEYSRVTWVSPPLRPASRADIAQPDELAASKAAFAKCWSRVQPNRLTCSDDLDSLLETVRMLVCGSITLTTSFAEAENAQTSQFLADFMDYVHQNVERCSSNCWGVPPRRNYIIDTNGNKLSGSGDRFGYVFEQRIRGRKLFQTAHGTYGIGPDHVLEGDLIVALIGGSSPYALRPTAEGFLCLGIIYIDGLMDGTYFESLRDGGTEPRQFTLI